MIKKQCPTCGEPVSLSQQFKMNFKCANCSTKLFSNVNIVFFVMIIFAHFSVILLYNILNAWFDLDQFSSRIGLGYILLTLKIAVFLVVFYVLGGKFVSVRLRHGNTGS